MGNSGKLRESFTNAEREALRADGALTYTLVAETISDQRDSQAKKGKPSFRYLVNAGDRLTASRNIEVAIYPAPGSFFVPGTFNRSVIEQEKLVEADAQELRTRLGLENIGEILPDEAATLTQVVFQHLDATGKWLFGQEYAKAQGLDWVYGRTKNPTNSSGSNVANVGDASPDYGLYVFDWLRDRGYRHIGTVRLVVPVEIK